MFNGFGINFESFGTQTCQFVVILGNQVVENSMLPDMFAKNRFIATMQQTARDNRPIQIQCIKEEETENTGRILRNRLVFSNNTFIKTFGEEICQV
jgi:hypothetical protein